MSEETFEPEPALRHQHYGFAHQLLPHVVFSPRRNFAELLLEQGPTYLERLWESPAILIPPDMDIVPHPKHDVIQKKDGSLWIFIEMPPPRRRAEAYFILILSGGTRRNPIAVILSWFVRRPVLFRYFTLELSSHENDVCQTCLCEWVSDLGSVSHRNHGEGPVVPERQAFLAAVEQKIASEGNAHSKRG